MANAGLRKLNQPHRNAAAVHHLARQHEKRDRHQREDVEAGNKALEPDQQRQPFMRERGERRERPQREDRPKREPKQALQGVDMVTYRIEVGHNDQIKPSNIVGAIANEADIESQYIGHIKLYDEFSTVELPAGMPDALLQHLQKVRVGPKLMRIAPLDKNAVLPESDRPARAPSKRPAKKSYAKSNDRGNDGTRPVKKKKYGKLKQGGKKAD